MICCLPCFLWFTEVIPVVPLLHILTHSGPMSTLNVAEKHHFLDWNFAMISYLFILPLASHLAFFLVSPTSRLWSLLRRFQRIRLPNCFHIVSEFFLVFIPNCFRTCFWRIFRIVFRFYLPLNILSRWYFHRFRMTHTYG